MPIRSVPRAQSKGSGCGDRKDKATRKGATPRSGPPILPSSQISSSATGSAESRLKRRMRCASSGRAETRQIAGFFHPFAHRTGPPSASRRPPAAPAGKAHRRRKLSSPMPDIVARALNALDQPAFLQLAKRLSKRANGNPHIGRHVTFRRQSLAIAQPTCKRCRGSASPTPAHVFRKRLGFGSHGDVHTQIDPLLMHLFAGAMQVENCPPERPLSMTIVPITSPDLDAAEVSWFSALCSDDYQFLGVPDGDLRSSFAHCRDITLEAEAQGLPQHPLPVFLSGRPGHAFLRGRHGPADVEDQHAGGRPLRRDATDHAGADALRRSTTCWKGG